MCGLGCETKQRSARSEQTDLGRCHESHHVKQSAQDLPGGISGRVKPCVRKSHALQGKQSEDKGTCGQKEARRTTSDNSAMNKSGIKALMLTHNRNKRRRVAAAAANAGKQGQPPGVRHRNATRNQEQKGSK